MGSTNGKAKNDGPCLDNELIADDLFNREFIVKGIKKRKFIQRIDVLIQSNAYTEDDKAECLKLFKEREFTSTNNMWHCITDVHIVKAFYSYVLGAMAENDYRSGKADACNEVRKWYENVAETRDEHFDANNGSWCNELYKYECDEIYSHAMNRLRIFEGSNMNPYKDIDKLGDLLVDGNAYKALEKRVKENHLTKKERAMMHDHIVQLMEEGSDMRNKMAQQMYVHMLFSENEISQNMSRTGMIKCVRDMFKEERNRSCKF